MEALYTTGKNAQIYQSEELFANESMRIASGWFKTIPNTSLKYITGESQLQLRWNKLSLNNYYKAKIILQKSGFKFGPPKIETLSKSRNTPTQFAFINKQIIFRTEFTDKHVMAEFLYFLTMIKEHS